MDKEILFVGNFNWYFYEEALIDGFKLLNVKTSKFEIKTSDLKSKFLNFLDLRKVNINFFQLVKTTLPDVIFFYRTNEIFPSTLNKIKKIHPDVKLLFFHNDNPFFGLKHRIKYFLYLSCLKYSDLTYVYRPSNINDAKLRKAKDVRLLYPYYCSKLHLREEKYNLDKADDIIFIGHCEQDRGAYINALLEADIKVRVFGPGWNKIEKNMKWPTSVVNDPVYGDDYCNTIAASKMALCFLSKINNDVYTRRNFEIPAIGTIVVSEFSKELAELFIPDKEILLFKNENELVEKVKNALSNENYIKEVSAAGQRKVMKVDFSENGTAKKIYNDILTLCK